MRLLLSGLILLTLFSCNSPATTVAKYDPPSSPQESLSKIHIRDGFRVELFASEPQIADPVEMIFDQHGRIFVVEMPDYPYKPDVDKANSRVRMLEDQDGDGVIDQSVIFADGLMEATSILPWKDGLIVTSAPDILYLKDTDGDGKADSKEVLFTGFFDQNPETQITNLRYGVDNWIYAANFGKEGTISSPLAPDHPTVDVLRADFRFRLDPIRFEAAAGPTQFGHTQDDWGHRFVTMNTVHLRHLVIPHKYLAGNPLMEQYTALANTYQDSTHMYQLTPPPHWRAVRTARRQKRYDEQGSGRIEWAEDHFTGCSGSTFYLADGFPEAFYGSVFTGDVAGNLVHRDMVKQLKSSPTFHTMRPPDEQDHEFLASTDSWFRPANFAIGPDGMLYVIDMYRQHIETPLSIPEDLKREMDFYAGDDMGRIYRVVPEAYKGEKWQLPNLEIASSEELVDYLAHKNIWYRLNAQRLLVERQDVSVSKKLREMVKTHPMPQARLHALYTLDGIGELDEFLLMSTLQDSVAGVRENAIKLSGKYPVTYRSMAHCLVDTSATVVLQAILNIGETTTIKNRALHHANYTIDHFEDPWYRLAILSIQNTAKKALDLLLALEERAFFDKQFKKKSEFVQKLVSWASTGDDDTITELENWMETSNLSKDWKKLIEEGMD